ncbi:unnamed protein product [Choristocarpus tenellus]
MFAFSNTFLRTCKSWKVTSQLNPWIGGGILSRGNKTRSSAKKRFRLTSSGNVKRGQAGMRHGTGPKPRSKLQQLGQTRLVDGKQKKMIKWMLGG